MNQPVTVKELFALNNPLIKPLLESAVYPWEALPKLKAYLLKLMENGLEGFREIAPSVWAEEGVTVHESAVLNGPAILCKGTEVRPGAYLRGSVFAGENCVLGNSCEFKNCILLDFVQTPHYNYVGDSILGNHAHLGAGATCSNLKNDKTSVVVHGETDYPTGLRKMGGILGDYAEVGCHSVLNPGTIVCKNTTVYPLVALRGVLPENHIVKDMQNIVPKKAASK